MDLERKFTIKIHGVYTKPLKILEINDSYVLAIYKGTISEYDLYIKFIQKNSKTKTGWSYIRTPKHIHWTVDILIKMSHYPDLTKDFVSFLIGKWSETVPNLTEEQRNNPLEVDEFIVNNRTEIDKYLTLNSKGEYSVIFLLILAKLLMQQEKNNKNDAYMFIQLLEKIRDGGDIFSVISKATHNGR